MIRVGLFSQDSSLEPLLSSALGNEFRFSWESTEQGIQRLLSTGYLSVVILDLNSRLDSLEERFEAARRMVRQKAAWIILADDGLRGAAAELVNQGAYGYCRRPPSVRDLRTMLRQAHENSSLKERLVAADLEREVLTDCNRIVGSSRHVQELYRLIDTVANNAASVLILGESGTGKELVARAIHSRGSRASRPFVAVACGAIPETLIEAELFGHEKGAFTGTVSTREGYFEQAADGTIFLDEIGELSPYTQVKLLRVLQQREFSRLGSSKLIPLRARFVFATHRDLDEMVAEGKFRQDLYYRINVMRIETPALQDHSEDIPQIATHYQRHYAQLFQKPVTNIDALAMAVLQSYSWPGNVRELENVIQRAVIVSQGTSLRVEDLPAEVHAEDRGDSDESDGSFERQLRDYKLKLAADAIRENNGSKTLAARKLRISRSYLHRLIRNAGAEMDFEAESKVAG
ncbi:MAG TPA: sigma-54 dependent transcriptional regulator [Terracidiphilus sp.]|nr:sigma-54 dependent transcriptional regulator [Terracidiphilus sp.]